MSRVFYLQIKCTMNFSKWIVYLKCISLFFAAQGLLWAIIGSFDPFGIYDSLMAKTFFNQPALPPDAERVFRFILAPFGATSAGYFVLQYFIAAHAFASQQKWGYQAIVAAFLLWFITDTSLSFYHGAYFNIWMANIPALLLMLPVIIFTRQFFR